MPSGSTRNVAGLDVAVDDAVAVSIVEGRSDGLYDVEGGGRGGRGPLSRRDARRVAACTKRIVM